MLQDLNFYITPLILSLLFYSSGFPVTAQDIISRYYKEGQFTKVHQIIDSHYSDSAKNCPVTVFEIIRAKMERIQLDFSKTEADIKEELLLYFPDLTNARLEAWEKSNQLEMRLIDGEKRYFRNAVPNLFRTDSSARQVKINRNGEIADPLTDFCLSNTNEIIKKYLKNISPEELTSGFRIDFTITLKPDAVPSGETIKCWMPFPRESLPRQKNVKLLWVNSDEYILADNSLLQRSLFAEKTAVSGVPTVFSYSAEFETMYQWYRMNQKTIKPYDKSSDIYKHYTSERPPHILFSEDIKKLAAEITKGKVEPFEKVKAIYYWINENIRWASALEYSTFECIPHYVLENRRGDCGMQTLLFMSLARYSGIPCKWQSGWMLHPGQVNLHDWCEVYYEGVGWVPLDQSFGIQQSENELVKEFYISGIDGYRLIINDDFSSEFLPQKKYFRSEPIDFQRGELEWTGGNLYFNTWSYDMQVTFLNK